MADFVHEILVNASPETVFGFLTETDKLLQWMGTDAELDPRPGGVYRVLASGKFQAAGEFVEVVPNERVAFTFGWDEEGHPIPAGSTRVDIDLVPDGDKTLVRFVHSGLPADAVDDHSAGWNYYFGRLTVVLDGGDPGPDAGPADGAG